MVKSAGFLKKLKKVGQLIGKGASWVNENVVKPLRPVINTALDMTGFGAAKPILDIGSNWLDSNFGTKPDKTFQKGIEIGKDIFLDTQRAPSQKKYGGLW